MEPDDDSGGTNGGAADGGPADGGASGGGTVHSASEHGTVASHPTRDTQPFNAAPTTGTDFNTVGLDLIVVACLSLHDMLFDFDSSFVNQGVTVILKELPGLRDRHKNAKGQLPPVSVFGHADPVGEDEYNKQLSGRRARAIYGLLTHDLAMWNALYQAEWSSKDVLKAMRERLGAPAGTPRDQLFQDYMKLLFPTPLAKADFLGKGASSKGLADYQGCSDFNPLIVLSTSENQTLLKSVRNARNQPDRRVVVFLYRAGTNVNTDLWPCPTATDGTAKCRQRFFAGPPAGDARRKPGAVHKEFAVTKDTFACRFYDRMARLSPCEQPAEMKTIRIRLFDPFTVGLSESPYQVTAGGAVFKTKADADGFLTFQLASIPKDCQVEWGQTEDGSGFLYSMKVFLNMDGLSAQDEVQCRLHNLGYVFGDTVADNVNAFQSDYGLTPTGQPADVQSVLRNWHNDPMQIQARPDQSEESQ